MHQLESQFSEEEVEEAVFSVDKDKSPGLKDSPCFSTKCVGRLLNLTLGRCLLNFLREVLLERE